MLDAFIIEEIKKREQEHDSQRPRVELPIPEPTPHRQNDRHELPLGRGSPIGPFQGEYAADLEESHAGNAPGHVPGGRTEEARLVVRAKIVLGLAAGERPYQVAARVGVGRAAAYEWLHRFNAEGLKGLTDHPRPGRPPTYTAEQRAEVIAAALTKPEDLGLPFASWTTGRPTYCCLRWRILGGSSSSSRPMRPI